MNNARGISQGFHRDFKRFSAVLNIPEDLPVTVSITFKKFFQ